MLGPLPYCNSLPLFKIYLATLISVWLCLSLVEFFFKYILDILVDIPEVDVALSRVTVPRNRSVDKRMTKTDQVVVGGKYSSDEGIRDNTF